MPVATNAQVMAQAGELGEVLEARGFAYGLLAQAFLAEPERMLIPSLAESGAVGLFPYAEEPGLIRDGVAEVAAYVGDAASVTDEGYGSLLWDYTRLFIGPGKVPAPPWESAYRSAERLLFQEETLGVRRAYAAYGLASAKVGSEPDDHMGLELQFMYETCRVAAERLGAGDWAGVEQVLRDQRAFLDEHLLQWAGDFAADVVVGAQVGFYRGLGRVLQGFLPVDRGLLEELLVSAAD
ncbi:MAG: dmsD2 [Symbiobacteriaceae bacterium]|jgi:TorA maturation chaperone TorD|nr:dmsD2 [Symbiobacteriaceae bacterium]